MDTQRTNSHPDAQRHHGIPPIAERPVLNFQPNAPAPAPAQDTNATIPNCSCQWCSDAQRRQPAWYRTEEQDAQQSSNPVAPYVNQDQGIDNRVETAFRSWAQFVPPQPERIQDNFGYAPVRDRAGPSNLRLVPTSTLDDTSMAEDRRRLAARYFNDAEAYVSVIRLEPGPLGRFQVIITLEMTTL